MGTGGRKCKLKLKFEKNTLACIKEKAAMSDFYHILLYYSVFEAGIRFLDMFLFSMRTCFICSWASSVFPKICVAG